MVNNTTILAHKNKPIGILADSHGHRSLLKTGITILKHKECQPIIHLGDICDSARIHTADESVCLIQHHRILAIKGNNDHLLCVSGDPHISPSTKLFLRDLPLVLRIQDIVFSHSLPFEKELGLACMIQDLNQINIQMFMNSLSNDNILFRGHSHQPELIQPSYESYERIQLDFPGHLQLSRSKKSIVTCGALLNSHCAIFFPETMMFYGIAFSHRSDLSD